MALSDDTLRAVRKYGRDGSELDKFSRAKYGISGTALLAKLIKGESGDRNNAVSSAGARGRAQFMPGTRQEVLKRFGVDPWKDSDSAAKAASLHLLGKLGHRQGLEGYNPGGGQSYVKYILGQKVGDVRAGGQPVAKVSRGRAVETTPAASAAPVVDDGARRAALQSYLAQRGRPDALANLAMGLRQARAEAVAPASDAAPAKKQSAKTVRPVAGGSLKPAGGFKGTQGPTQKLMRVATDLGLQVTNTKRHNKNPYSGKNSDHDHGNKDAFAADLSNGSAPTPEMDRAAFRIARRLGIRDYKMGTPINRTVTINGIRYQLIYRGTGAAFGGNHMDHIHIGAKRVG